LRPSSSTTSITRMDSSPNPPPSFLPARNQLMIPNAIADLALGKESTLLSGSFAPNDYDIICGRGRGTYNRQGNKRFRVIVHQNLPEYTATKTKLDRSLVLISIIEQVETQNNGNVRLLKSMKPSKKGGLRLETNKFVKKLDTQ
jgi:hypothetical protein